MTGLAAGSLATWTALILMQAWRASLAYIAARAPLSPTLQKPPGSASVIMTTSLRAAVRKPGVKSPVCRVVPGAQSLGSTLPLAVRALTTVLRHSSVLSGAAPPRTRVTESKAVTKAGNSVWAFAVQTPTVVSQRERSASPDLAREGGLKGLRQDAGQFLHCQSNGIGFHAAGLGSFFDQLGGVRWCDAVPAERRDLQLGHELAHPFDALICRGSSIRRQQAGNVIVAA